MLLRKAKEQGLWDYGIVSSRVRRESAGYLEKVDWRSWNKDRKWRGRDGEGVYSRSESFKPTLM